MISRTRRTGVAARAATSFALLPFAGVLLAAALMLGACNTAEGVGDDLEDAGEEVGDALD